VAEVLASEVPAAELTKVFSEAYEGRLVKLKGVTTITTMNGSSLPAMNGNSNYLINGQKGAQIRINTASNGDAGLVGKAIPNCEILVLRPDGSLCNDDEPGELVHRGAHVALGYWNDAARTAERFRPLPSTVAGGLVTQFAVWSGDVVRRDSEGFLFYIGRRDEQIKVSGYRVSPSEIETVFGAHPGVSEVVVFGVPDEQLGQVPVAAVATGSASIDASHLSEFCTRQLPSYMVPRIVMYDTLPRTPNGKFDRHALRQSYFEQLNAPTGNLR